MSREALKNIPGVDKLLNDDRIKQLLNKYNRDFVVYCLRLELSSIRNNNRAKSVPSFDQIVDNCTNRIEAINNPTLKKVINATGIVLHTNFGRAPLGSRMMSELMPVLEGYSNLEFNLHSGKRGKRTDHVKDLIKYVTNAEGAVVVNNNAAAVSLVLRTFAEGREVIVSRGELIEIGGSFRLPEIMSASGAKTREVGTTNRTRLSDYESAISDNTSIILKANRSNYSIEGFTEEAEVKDLCALAKKNKVIFVYDIGSGLLKNFDYLPDLDEPDVKTSIAQGVDLVTFSCDKLLGGPQAGIIAGRKDLISVLAKSPLMRTYRVDKFTIAALVSVLRCYLHEEELPTKLPAHKFIVRKKDELKMLAEKLKSDLDKIGVKTEIEESSASCGGGTVPHLKLDSFALKIVKSKDRKDSAGELNLKLLSSEYPVAGIVKEGNYFLDVFTLEEDDIPHIINALQKTL